MANKKTRALSQEEFERIISAIRHGFVAADQRSVKPNERIATALVVEANLGLRIGDILRLRLSDIVSENNRYRLNIVEEKTRKARTFTVPNEVYTYLQSYALANDIKPQMKLFDISVRTVQNHLQMICEHLGIQGVSTHSFRKMFATEIYRDNDCNIELVRVLLQHSSTAITQRYISIEPKVIEQALLKHVAIPQ